MAYLPSVILLLLAVAGVWVSSRMFGHPISPFSVFYGVWFFTLGLFFLRWVEYTPVRPQAWSLIALNLVSFGSGWILAYLFQRPGVSNWKMELASERVSPERLRKVIYVSFALGMVGLAEFLRRVQVLLGLATYLVAPSEIREAMGIGGGLDEGIKPFNWLNIMTVVLCVFYLHIFRSERRKLVWVILLAGIVATLFIEDRMRFFFALLWMGYVLAHIRRWSRRKLLATGLVLATVLGVQFFVVASWLGKIALNNATLLEAANVDEAMYPLLTPYSSLTGSYPALQAYLDTRPESTDGRMTFYPAFKFLRLFDPSLKLPQILADPVSIPSEFNTFTWLHQFYNDFGVAGVIFGPMCVAFLSGLIYFHMLRRKSFYSIFANGLICFGITLTFYGNLLTEGPTWYFLAVGIPIARYITRPVPALAQR
jgi:oligosaccharide repeat unit polymerase